MLNLVIRVAICVQEIICMSKYGTWTWRIAQWKHIVYTITLEINFVFCTKMIVYLTNSSVAGVQMTSKNLFIENFFKISKLILFSELVIF
jgi:hypothetical protein